jgi:hypothetical protein
LQAGRDPNDVDGHIDCRDEDGNSKFETIAIFLIREKDGTSIDDNLKKELNLEICISARFAQDDKRWTYLKRPSSNYVESALNMQNGRGVR